jgi:hypothetical protein
MLVARRKTTTVGSRFRPCIQSHLYGMIIYIADENLGERLSEQTIVYGHVGDMF